MPLACTCNTSALSSEDGGNDNATLPFDVIPPLPFANSFDMGDPTRPEDSPRRAMDGGARGDTPHTSRSRRRRETTVASKAEAGPSSINPTQLDTPLRSHDRDQNNSGDGFPNDSMNYAPDLFSSRSHDRSQSRQPKARRSPPASGSELSDDQRLMARNLWRLPGVRQAMGQATKGVAKHKVRRIVARGKAKLKRAFMRASDDKSSGTGSRGRRKVKRRTSKALSSGSSAMGQSRAAKWVHNQSYRSAGNRTSPRSHHDSREYSFQLSSPPVNDSGEPDSSLSFGSPMFDFSAPDSQSTPAKLGRRVRAPSITDSLAYEESQEQWRQSEQSLGTLRGLQNTSTASAEATGTSQALFPS